MCCLYIFSFFFFKQKTAYEMRISDWSSDVCSSDLLRLDTGRDQLACVHLTDKPMLRWYAACCRLPLFNSHANGKLPFFTAQFVACDPATRDRLIGPPRGHLFLQEGVEIGRASCRARVCEYV